MTKTRKRHAYSIAELPAVLFVLFILLTFPLINLVSVSLRYCFCSLAVQEAAIDAAVSKTFQQDASAQDPSAVNSARSTITRVLAKFNGIDETDFHLRIVTTNIDTGITSRQETPLTAPADTNTNLYMMEPELIASLQPLVAMPILGLDIPGLTRPMEAVLTARKYCENPQGLNQ